jgi:hypothetical protein
MRACTKVGINGDIFRHDARNLQLSQPPLERGIDFRGGTPNHM